MTYLRSSILCLALLAAAGAQAESVPASGNFDARIKEVQYNPSDVVRVVGHYGYSTDIEFAAGETIKNIALGDTLAWDVAPADNHLFVKPREDNAATNMTVITDRRIYQIALDARRTARTGGKSSHVYFLVRFRYPEDDAARMTAEAKERETVARQRQVESALRKKPDVRNWTYYACGDKALWPAEVFDDGRFTWMRFPAAQQIPAVFEIGPGKAESVVDGAMEGEYYVVHHTAKRFVLRQGKAVACVENRAYNRYGIATPTGTRSSEIERVVKKVEANGAVTTQGAPRPVISPPISPIVIDPALITPTVRPLAEPAPDVEAPKPTRQERLRARQGATP
ncbi:P-type conjugative transfer protein VirB9 [Pinirhizobacter sp.]|jgi:type IV secretion system protein VirB9|uniref:P-type conjugative transfer protein VirB9 n=1 Tax=Pinirhizobacter sp. TaxID=2950432 RepID=UPI002F3E3500